MDFTSALRLRPNYAEAFSLRAWIYEVMGRHADAIADYTSLIGIDPYATDPYLRRLLILQELHRYAEAVADCDAILARWPKLPFGLKPPQATIYWQRGDLSLALGQYDQTIADDSTAIDMNNRLDAAYADRGLAYLFKNQFDAARSDLEDALDRSDKSAERASLVGGVDIKPHANSAIVADDLGFLEWMSGRFDRARADFAKALKIGPKSDRAVLGLAMWAAKTSSAEDLDKDASSVDLTVWPGQALALWLGKSSVDQVHSAAQQTDAGDLASRRCQENFYVGEWQMAHGQLAAARGSLQAAATACPPDIVEMAVARVDLGRMQIAETTP